MMPLWSLPAPGVVAALLSGALTGLVTRWLRARAILDHPNQRSSHAVPTPRGGGIGLLAALLPVLAAVAWVWPGPSPWPILAMTAALAALSFADDRIGLSAGLRFGAQLAVVALGLWLLPANGLVFQGLLPLPLDRLAAGFAWLWFVNLYNFMDGADGMAGVETAVLGLGLAAVAWAVGSLAQIGWGLAVAGAAAGFLVWNWHPAKVFLGDVGSIALGYLIGWLLLLAALDGAWAACLILPAYYWIDATGTLLRRLLRGERVWQAHREHLYQRAIQAGLGHDEVARRVLTTGLMLVVVAWVSVTGSAWLGLVAGAAIAFGLVQSLGRPATRSRRS